MREFVSFLTTLQLCCVSWHASFWQLLSSEVIQMSWFSVFLAFTSTLVIQWAYFHRSLAIFLVVDSSLPIRVYVNCWYFENLDHLYGVLYKQLQNEDAPIDDLMDLVQQIVAFHMKVWLTEMFYRTTWQCCGISFSGSCKSFLLLTYSLFVFQHNAEPEAVDLLMEVGHGSLVS